MIYFSPELLDFQMKEFFPAETVTGERAVEHVGRCMRVCVNCVLYVLLVEVLTPLQQKGWLYPVK